VEPQVFFIAIIGAMIAGFVQGLSGFGFGVTALAIWVWFLDPALAAAMAVTGALTGQIIGAFSMRRGLNLARLLPFLIGGLVGVPIGVGILPLLDPNLFKAIIGALLVVWCPLMLNISRMPKITVNSRLADGVIGILGGITGGLGGFTGIIPTLWCTLRGMSKDAQRAIIQNFNLGALTISMAAYVLNGLITAPMLPLLASIIPAILVPSLLGSRLYGYLSDHGFRRLVLGLLTISGVAMLLSALPQLIQ
jgi:uncharacterized membrane protein YfcA